MEERGEIHIEADCFCADLCQKGALKRQGAWQELFQYLDDPLDQSRFLMQLGLEKPSISELHRKECRIEGCKTNIWREIYLKEGRIVFRADSDSLVIRGALPMRRGGVPGSGEREAQRKGEFSAVAGRTAS